MAAYNDPKTLHSLSPNLMMETFVILEHAARDPACKVLVWTATGEKAFSSGAALRGDKAVHVPRRAVEEYKARGMASPAVRCLNIISDLSVRLFILIAMLGGYIYMRRGTWCLLR